MVLLSGCRFVVVRYHGNAENAYIKRCIVAEDNPNAIECWDYFDLKMHHPTIEVKYAVPLVVGSAKN